MVAGSVTSAAVPGAVAWDIVVGDRFIAATAAPAPDACMSALADAASDPRVSLESIVGVMPSGARDGTDSFALVYWPTDDPSEVTAVVRGQAVVDLASPGGTRRFDARDIQPWHLAEFGAVIALRVTGADAPLDRLGEAPDALRHARASLRASTIEWTSAPSPAPAKNAVPDAETVLMSRRRAGRPRNADDVGSRGHVEIAAADTVLTPRRAPASPARAAPVARTAPVVPRVPAAAGTSSAPGTPPGSTDVGGVAAQPEAAQADLAWFRVGDGPPRRVTGPVLIGRRPLGPRMPGIADAAPELLRVPSPGQIVSATHIELRVEGARLVATDLRSTNGTVIRTASGSRRMRAGESVVVTAGTSLDLGDGTIIEIVSAPELPPSDPTRQQARQ